MVLRFDLASMWRSPSSLRVCAVLIGLATLALFWGNAPTANAQEVDVAPARAVALLRHAARLELASLFERLDPEARRRLVGVYVAFDDSVSDVSAMAGCDDDGDYVVVVSDALLGLASFVAEAVASDEAYGTHAVDDYARFLAGTVRGRTRHRAVRPMPPPAGFFGASQTAPAARQELERRVSAARFREMVAAVLAHELERLEDGELVCPHPTATHERGDDEWTSEEQSQALAVASRLATRDGVLTADAAATTLLLEDGRTEQGGLAWLKVMASLERAGQPGQITSTYLWLHPDSGAREAVVRATAEAWRLLRSASPSVSRGTGPEEYSAPLEVHRE
jgi:hypothetical protein